MAPLATISLLALAITSSFARPHRASTGAAEKPGPASKPAVTGTAKHPVATGAKPKHTTKASDGNVLAELFGKLNGLIPREDADCPETVTTKLQVTVTVTEDAIETTEAAQNNYAKAGTSAAGQPAAYLTIAASPTTTRRHGKKHSSTVKAAGASGKSHASSLKGEGLAPSASGHGTSAKPVASAPAKQSEAAIVPYPEAPVLGLPTEKKTSTLHLTTTIPAPAGYTGGGAPSPSVEKPKTTTTAPIASVQPAAPVYVGKGKRGLAYNDAGLIQGFASSSKISWAYNWASSTSGLANGIMFIPTLWSNTAEKTKNWQANAQKAVANGSTHLFSFNEPDLGSQSNLSPQAAAASYKTYMSDMFGRGATKLCAPSITNGGGQMGFTWLKNFMNACQGCQIDCINIHWYGNSAADFEQHVKDAIAVAGGKELWISEFALNGNPAAATTQAFLQQTMSFLDNTDAVTGYAYFMASQDRLVNGNAPSNPVGTTYAS